MKTNLLEQLIKTALFEQSNDEVVLRTDLFPTANVRKTIISPMSKSQRNDVVENGGITGFNITIKYRGAHPDSNTEEIINYINKQLSANPSVGTTSKFQVWDKTEEISRYMYILGNDISKSKRVLKINVWVLLFSPLMQLAQQIDQLNNNTRNQEQITSVQESMIGRIPVYTYNDAVKWISMLKTQATKLDLKLNDKQLKRAIEFPTLAIINKQELDQELDEPVVSTKIDTKIQTQPDNSTTTPSVIIAPTQVLDPETADPIKPKYPTKSDSGETIVTMSDTDPYVYVKRKNASNDVWYTMKKSTYENGGSIVLTPIKFNKAVYDKLDNQLPADTIIQTDKNIKAPAEKKTTTDTQSAVQSANQTETQVGKMLTLKPNSSIQTYSEDTAGSLIFNVKIKAGSDKSLNKVKILQTKKLKNTSIAPAGTYYQIQYNNKKVWINSKEFI